MLISILTKHLKAEAVSVLKAQPNVNMLIISNAVLKIQIRCHSDSVEENTDFLVILIARSESEAHMRIPSK